MPSDVKISVILTVYKRQEFIHQALNSLCEQECHSFEVILADDSGQRLFETTALSYSKKLNIRYQANPSNIGIVNSIKTAIRTAQGQYLSIMNDDDLWQKDFLKKMLIEFNHTPEAALVFCDHWFIDAKGQILEDESNKTSRLYQRDVLPAGKLVNSIENVVLHKCVPLAMGSMFRKNLIDSDLIHPNIVGAYDYWITCLLLHTEFPFIYIKERLSYYRIHGEMETGRRSVHKNLNLLFIYDQLLKCNWFPQITRELKLKRRSANLRVGIDHWRDGKGVDSRKYFREDLKNGYSWKTILLIFTSYLPSILRKKL